MRKIRVFLGRYGVDTTQLTLQNFAVTDAQANIYGGDRGGPRYVITQTLMVRSTEPEIVAAASQKVAELVSEGVVLSSGEQYGNGAWGDVTIFGFSPKVSGMQVGDFTGAPQILLHGLASIYVEDGSHPSTEFLPQRPQAWVRYDEWYDYTPNPRGAAVN